jgi:hypothetical protein
VNTPDAGPICRCGLASAAALAALLSGAAAARAQAWVSDRHTLDLGLGYSFLYSGSIVDQFPTTFPGARVTNHNLTLDADYALLDRLAVSSSVTLVTVRFSGPGANYPPHGEFDDGDYHATLQDWTADVRYAVLQEPLAVTPFIGITLPTHDYESRGFAAVGRGLRELRIGAWLGRTLDPWLPQLYVHGQYEFHWSERVDAGGELTRSINTDRSDASLSIGYFLGERAEINLGANLRLAHGGFEFGAPADRPVIEWHDPLAAEDFLLVGGGGSYELSETISVRGLARFFLYGNNTRVAHMLGVSLEWSIPGLGS